MSWSLQRLLGPLSLTTERLRSDLLLRPDHAAQKLDHLVVRLQFHHLIQNGPHPGEDHVGPGNDRLALAGRGSPHRRGEPREIARRDRRERRGDLAHEPSFKLLGEHPVVVEFTADGEEVAGDLAGLAGRAGGRFGEPS